MKHTKRLRQIKKYNKHTNGSKGPKLIHQMSDLVFFEVLDYDEDTKEASLSIGS